MGALEHNLTVLRRLLPAGYRVAGVVKADTYGHELLPVARRLQARGAEALAVAILTEGQTLRRGSVTGPIWLLLCILNRPQARRAAKLGLTPICADLEAGMTLNAAGQALGRPVECQLKVDTGMNRLGGYPTDRPWNFWQPCAPSRTSGSRCWPATWPSPATPYPSKLPSKPGASPKCWPRPAKKAGIWPTPASPAAAKPWPPLPKAQRRRPSPAWASPSTAAGPTRPQTGWRTCDR
ncbi:hypothetical protein DFAR_1140001 [Desulfarculales bacterium]